MTVISVEIASLLLASFLAVATPGAARPARCRAERRCRRRSKFRAQGQLAASYEQKTGIRSETLVRIIWNACAGTPERRTI